MRALFRKIMLTARILILVCSAPLATSASAATALPLGTPLIVLDTGSVTAQFVGGESALFNNELYLHTPTNVLGLLFQNNTTTLGTMVNLGIFPVGTELMFRMHVVETNQDYFSGDSARNPDALPHNLVIELTNTDIAGFEGPPPAFPPNSLLRSANALPVSLVGFEDQFGGGDADYNDIRFLLTNVGAVPEPLRRFCYWRGLA